MPVTTLSVTSDRRQRMSKAPFEGVGSLKQFKALKHIRTTSYLIRLKREPVRDVEWCDGVPKE